MRWAQTDESCCSICTDGLLMTPIDIRTQLWLEARGQVRCWCCTKPGVRISRASMKLPWIELCCRSGNTTAADRQAIDLSPSADAHTTSRIASHIATAGATRANQAVLREATWKMRAPMSCGDAGQHASLMPTGRRVTPVIRTSDQVWHSGVV